MSAMTKPFDPRSRVKQLPSKTGNQDYLPVADRVAWFRDQWPHGTIETEHIEVTDQRAVFRCVARKVDADGTVKGSATGYGSETPGDFRDYIEKAETKAIGRAVAALGFGTQFLGDEDDRIVDSPVQRPRPPVRDVPPQNTATPAPAKETNQAAHTTAMRRLHAVGKDRNLSHDDLRALAGSVFTAGPVTSLKDLDARQLADLADLLQNADDDDLAASLSDALAKEPAHQVGLDDGTDVEAEYVAAILQAGDTKRLDEIAARLKEDGLSSPALRSAYQSRKRALTAGQ